MSEAEMRMRGLLLEQMPHNTFQRRAISEGRDHSVTAEQAIRAMLAAEAAAIERCAEIVGRDRRSEGAIKCGYIPKAQEVCWELATAIRSLKEGASHVG